VAHPGCTALQTLGEAPVRGTQPGGWSAGGRGGSGPGLQSHWRLAALHGGGGARSQLRHPNVLAFKDSIEIQEKGATVVYLITEPVKPLTMVLGELNLTGQHK
jgi:hypothetical protein